MTCIQVILPILGMINFLVKTNPQVLVLKTAKNVLKIFLKNNLDVSQLQNFKSLTFDITQCETQYETQRETQCETQCPSWKTIYTFAATDDDPQQNEECSILRNQLLKLLYQTASQKINNTSLNPTTGEIICPVTGQLLSPAANPVACSDTAPVTGIHTCPGATAYPHSTIVTIPPQTQSTMHTTID